MSLRTSLLLMYGLLLVVLIVALAGFYWAVEQSLTDQELLKTARLQLRDMEEFLAKSHGQVAETARFLLTNNTNPKIAGQLGQEAKTCLQRLVKAIHDELKAIQQTCEDGSHSAAYNLENEELGELLRVQLAHAELCDTIELAISRHQKQRLGKDEALACIAKCDDILSTQVNPRSCKLRDGELEIMLSREKAMFDTARLFERIAIGACLATFVIVLLGTHLLRRTLEELAKREGAIAADRAKSEFLANMSHEIRTPMTAILGFTDILIQGFADPEKINAAAIIKRNGEHLLEIINDILDLSKIDVGQFTVECESCSPSRIVADVVSLMRVRAEAKGLVLNVEFKGTIPETIVSSPLRLRQILINLVGNAIKFTEIGSVRLVVRLIGHKKSEPRLRFDVIDTGIGISKEDMAKLFKPFTQVDSSFVRAAEGTGLGLAISRRLANMLGGELSVTSVPGKGSTFTVTIQTGPLDDAKMSEHREEAIPQSSPSAAQTIAKERPKLSGRILLVEDGPDNQRLIAFLLKRAGAEVVLAENGIMALEKIEQAMRELASRGELESRAPFDVVLMDMQMPLMDGYEVTRRLRTMGYRHTIVALTAHAMSTDRQKCLDAGCDDYTTKPISEERLLATLASHLLAGVGDSVVAAQES
jgi:signal transduction histidine kinase/CheY-like chemotaxis protein